jgi:hypothetical protein
LSIFLREWVSTVTSAGLYTDYLAIASITTVSFAIGYFIKYLGIHKYTDNLFFGFRYELNQYIIRHLRDHFEKHVCKCPIDIKEEEFLDVFFEFINKQNDSHVIQRALYFSYYTKYGLSMNLFVLSLFGISVIVGINLYNNNYDINNALTYAFFITIATLAVLVSQLKIRREIMDDITRRQIYRIVYDESEALKEMLKNRFAGPERGQYRTQRIKNRPPQVNPTQRTVIGPLMIISGILLSLVGISEGLMAPVFSDIAEDPSQTDHQQPPAQIFSRPESIASLIIGLLLLGVRFIYPSVKNKSQN